MNAGRGRGSASTATATAAVVVALALGLAGCGVKSAPQHPEGASYPRQYPATGAGTTAPAEKAKEDQLSPLGFPYEYPNRPPPR
jgi:hypothetical protein